jgi:transcriptional regulator with XRE-family HTH domain
VDDDSEDFSDVPSPDVADPLTPEQLARAVRLRRAELRMSQEDIRRASGLSITTIGKIEHGAPDLVVQNATLRRLDVALGWPVGTAEAWYQGRAGVVPGAGGVAPSDLHRLVEELLPLLEEAGAQVARRRETPTALSVVGLPEEIVAALEQLLRAIRNQIAHGV